MLFIVKVELEPDISTFLAGYRIKILLVKAISEDYARDYVHEHFLGKCDIKIVSTNKILTQYGVLWERGVL